MKRTKRLETGADDTVDAGKGLSLDQALILGQLFKAHKERDAAGTLTVWGVPILTAGSASYRASVSRSLRRLEARGLILRQNNVSNIPGLSGRRRSADDPHRKTTHVAFTDIGLAYMERLTKPGA